jgi:hypothetical protein
MKIILSTIFVFLTLAVSAQLLNIPNELTITEKLMVLDKTERNGFSVELEGEEKDVLKQFASFTEALWGVNLKSKSDEVRGEDLMVPTFSDKHFGIEAYFVSSNQGNELRFFVLFGTDIFVNSKDYPTESANCMNHLRAFAKKYYEDYVNGMLAEKKEVLEKSQKSLLGIKKDISSQEKDRLKEQKAIEKLEQKNVKNQDKIRKYQESIEDNNADIVKANSEIESIEKKKVELLAAEEEANKVVETNTIDVNKLQKMLSFVKGF